MSLVEKIKRAVSLRGLPLRAVIFGLGWFLLPFWLFVLLALCLYLVPFFGVKRFFLPFLAIIFFAAIEPRNFLFAIVFAGVFYMILGVKELVFIERKSAYEALTLLVEFFAFIKFFPYFDSWSGYWPFMCSLLLGFFVFLLSMGFLNYGGENVSAEG